MLTTEPTRRRFGKYPANGPHGILTAKAAYLDGYETGCRWQHDHVPGGPWVCGDSKDNAHAPRDTDWISFCEATLENHREWLRGWHDARTGKVPKPPDIDIDHFAILGYN